VAFPQNAYPNFTNYPFPSFPEGVVAPDVDPFVDMKCVRYNPAWSPVLMSACSQLLQLSSWQGTDDEKKLAVMRATNLQQQLQDFQECEDMSCCPDPLGIPVLHRVTDDGTIQISVDGGVTWVNDATDPRLTQPQLPPITGSGDLSCQAASNIVAAFKPIQTALAVLLTGSVALLALATAIAGVLAAVIFDPGDAYRLIPVVIRFAVEMVTETESAFNDAFTDAVWHQLLCAVQSAIGSDGIFSDSEVGTLNDLLDASGMDAVPLNALHLIITGVGTIGLNNMASQPAALEDCSCLTPCSTTWSVPDDGFHGTINNPDTYTADGFVDVSSGILIPSQAYVILFAPTDADCCTYDHIEPVGDSITPSSFGYDLCGESFTIGAPHHGTGAPGGQSIRTFQAQAFATFRIKVFFTP